MKFNRQIFFSTYRAAFGELTQEQVDGLNSLLHNFETYYGWWNDVDQIANALSQIKHETAHSFQPVCEAYYLGDPDQPNYYQGNTDRVRRVQQGFRYYPYFGRSYIQLTWAENYEKFDALLRRYFPELVQQLELRTGEPLDLMAKPNQALDPDVSFAIMTIGMHKGIFRAGHTLDRYINAAEVDHFAAREIVNGDKNYRVKLSSERIGVRIANEALKFTKILKSSLEKDSAEVLPADVPATPTAEDVHAVEPTPTGNDLTGLQPQEQPPTQIAENIINNDASSPQPIPLGDLPSAEPSFFMRVADWKPWAVRWISRIWTVQVPANLSNIGANLYAAIQDPANWGIYAAIAGVLLVVFVGFAIFASLVIGGIYMYQNRGIAALKVEQLRSFADPNRKNIGLDFVAK